MRTSLLAAAAVLLPASAFAAGYAVPNTNSRDEGMGGSAVANQTGPEAAYANGAALAGHDGLMVSGAFTLIFLNSTWTSLPGSATASSTAAPATPPNLNLSYGFKAAGLNMAVGLAMGVPGGGQMRWADDWPGRANIVLVDRRVFSYDLVYAVQPIEQLKVSVGGAYFYTTEHLKQKLVFGGIPDGEAELGTSGGKLSWTAALEAKPFKDVPLRFGFQYKHKADMVLTGAAHFSGVPDALKTSGLVDQGATHNLTFPNVVNTGLAYDVSKDLTLQAAVTFFRFIVYKADDFIGDKKLTIHLPFNYTNSMTYRLGGEYGGLTPGLKLRLGLLRDVSPQPKSTVSPALPDSSRWAVSAGAGYDFTPSLAANLAFEYAKFDALAVDPSSDAFQGSYDTHATVISVGLTYKMK